MIHRRKFIKTAGLGMAVAAVAPRLLSCNASGKNAPQALKDFGIQLYTLRDVMPKQPKEVLKKLAAMGYTQIESYEGEQGMYWGMGAKGMQQYVEDLGMKIVSSHTNIREDFERKAAEAAAIGMSYLIDPWEGPQKTIDDFKKIADTFNEKGAICKKEGIGFGYHNHAYSFEPVDGQLPQDVMMKNTEPDLVDFEMDIYWVVTAGADPIEWLNKYPGRFKLSHIKDRLKDAPADKRDATTVAGTGSIDFEKILPLAKEQGMEYFLIEQEQYQGVSSLEAAAQCAEYMKGVKV